MVLYLLPVQKLCSQLFPSSLLLLFASVLRVDEIEFCRLKKLINPLSESSHFLGVIEAQEAREGSQMTFVVCVDGLGLEPVARLPTLWISSWHCSGRVPGTACLGMREPQTGKPLSGGPWSLRVWKGQRSGCRAAMGQLPGAGATRPRP